MKIVLSLLLIGSFVLIACKSSEDKFEQTAAEKEWQLQTEKKFDDIAPTGLQTDGEFLWISDAKNNRVIKSDLSGNILKIYDGIKRPMHLSIYNSKVYVPEYLTDKIKIISNDEIGEFPLKEKPDAPAGVFVNDSLIAIADFYNHRIILQRGNNVLFIGKEGHKKGELYYPTDVSIANDKIYVADAYNNRVQVFDIKGNSLKIIGDKDKINVATGIEVISNNIFVTDFEGSRILIYNLNGELLQIITGHLNKPTDISVYNNVMYVANFNGSSVSILKNCRSKRSFDHLQWNLSNWNITRSFASCYNNINNFIKFIIVRIYESNMLFDLEGINWLTIKHITAEISRTTSQPDILILLLIG